MSTNPETVQYVHDQAGLGRRLESKKMFGEYALYLDGKIVALVCDDQLFLKPTPAGKAWLGKVSEAPPYPGAKNYYLLAAELDDPERLGAVLQVTADALPAPVPKRSKGKKGSAPAKRVAGRSSRK